MMVKRVAGALGAELSAVNLGDGLDAELAGTLRACLSTVLFFRDRTSNPPRKKHWPRFSGRYKHTYNTVEACW